MILFTVGDAKVMGGFLNCLSSKWECDHVALLAQGQPVRLRGIERNFFSSLAERLHRGLEELLRPHGHKGCKTWSMGPGDQLLLTPEEEEELLEKEVDLAETPGPKARGQALWLMSRSRPDLQYLVALMASWVSKNHKVVNQTGHRLLDYLCQTVNYCLVVGGSEEPDDEVNGFTDSSFAPAAARSHGAAVVTYK